VDSAAANHNFDATFRADLALKDVGIALEAADAAGLHTPAAYLAREQFRWLAEEGLGGKDCSLVVKYVTRDGTVEGYQP
jgi:3-hydroxyisobutyrate dehydrogenase